MTDEINTADGSANIAKRASKLIMVIAVVLTFLNMFIAPALTGVSLDSQRWGEFLGALLGPVVFGLIVVCVSAG